MKSIDDKKWTNIGPQEPWKFCSCHTPLYPPYLPLSSQFFLLPHRNNELDFKTTVLKEANKKTHHKQDLICACPGK